MLSSSSAFLGAALALAAVPASAQDVTQEVNPPPSIGVMTTIPIFWGEPSEFIDDFVGSPRQLHWAKSLLEQHYWLMPVDYLAPGGLNHFDGIVLAQPRGLSGEENVAIDTYVRQGGRVFLLADPMMTGHTVFPIGDRRRPQDIALLSPILARWGLRLRFDETQTEGLRHHEFGENSLPVNLAGIFETADGNCVLTAEAVIARCTVGEGEVLAVADAAVLDLYDPPEGAETALIALATSIFPENGDGTGINRSIPMDVGDSLENTDETASLPPIRLKRHSRNRSNKISSL